MIEVLLLNCMFSARMIKRLINDLLDLAKLQNGKFNFNNEYFNLKETIMESIKQMEYMAKQKNIEILCEFKDAR